jgi:hypothetical protein
VRLQLHGWRKLNGCVHAAEHCGNGQDAQLAILEPVSTLHEVIDFATDACAFELFRWPVLVVLFLYDGVKRLGKLLVDIGFLQLDDVGFARDVLQHIFQLSVLLLCLRLRIPRRRGISLTLLSHADFDSLSHFVDLLTLVRISLLNLLFESELLLGYKFLQLDLADRLGQSVQIENLLIDFFVRVSRHIGPDLWVRRVIQHLLVLREARDEELQK